MTDTPWTPGPWETFPYRRGIPVAMREGTFVAVDGRLVARAHLSDKTGLANARLIAAAPEMAEFLDWFARDYPEVRELMARIRGEADA